MKLSTHLDLSEVIRSESAKRNGISNVPTKEHLENLKLLALMVFEPVRNNFMVPIRISSGYRSVELNAFIKGSKSSQHCKGEAIDIDNDGSDVTNSEIFEFIRSHVLFDQLIWEYGNDTEPDWVHVSFSKTKNRKHVLRAYKEKGVTKYKNF